MQADKITQMHVNKTHIYMHTNTHTQTTKQIETTKQCRKKNKALKPKW